MHKFWEAQFPSLGKKEEDEIKIKLNWKLVKYGVINKKLRYISKFKKKNKKIYPRIINRFNTNIRTVEYNK